MRAQNDKNMLTDVLMHLKDLMTAHGMAIKHSNCEKMRAMVTGQSGKVAGEQFALFKYMNENGMYPIENAEPKKVQEAIKMHSKA